MEGIVREKEGDCEGREPSGRGTCLGETETDKFVDRAPAELQSSRSLGTSKLSDNQ